SSRRRHTRSKRDWSSDVCSSDLGSTAEPRGVMLTHGNIFANMVASQDRLLINAQSRGISWLPPYHDLGLMGGLVMPIFAGFPIRSEERRVGKEGRARGWREE